MVYLDSSAIVKLVVTEPESGALRQYLAAHDDRIASGLARVEVFRALRRSTGGTKTTLRRAEQVLEAIALVAVDDPILRDAAALEPRAAKPRCRASRHRAFSGWTRRRRDVRRASPRRGSGDRTEGCISQVRSTAMPATRLRFALVGSAALTVQLAGCAGAPPDDSPIPFGPEAVAGWQMVDLSHAYGGSTLYWPTDTTGFQLDTLAEGPTPGGYFYAAKQFATAEHGGTHLDAPSHFAEGGADAAAVPLERLILPGIVIDVRASADADPDYLLTAGDVQAWEDAHGRVPEGAAVLIRTGWAAPLARCTRLSRRRYARGRRQPALPRHRRRGGAPTGGGPPCSAARYRHRQRGPRPVHRLHRPPDRCGGRCAQPGERRRPLPTAPDRFPARRATDEDRGWNRRPGQNRCIDPTTLTRTRGRGP